MPAPAIAPQAPFPLVVAQATERAFIAPGVALARYDLVTNRGPLVVRVVTVDPRQPGTRIAAVLAHDRLVSSGETVSSMAHRTGAIAGINADYFDIGQTNQPLGIVVRGGELIRTPSRRAAMTIVRGGGARFGTYAFSGTATSGATTWPIGAVNEWPAQGSAAALMSPEFGAIPGRPGGAFARLAATGATGPSWNGTYRVAAVDTSGAALGPSLGLAFGPAAVAAGNLPSAGESVTVDATTQPTLDGVGSALGGGPMLVSDAQPFDDPNPPSPAEALARDPQAGAFARGDGSVAFIEVDGRFPDYSVGLTRPEFAALMLSLGARDGIGFDSGGSATLVVRSPGDAAATLANSPSDGVERPVADGFFVYDDEPRGTPALLAVRPGSPVLLTGATFSPYAVVTDAAGHPLQTPAEALAAMPRLRLTIDPPTLARVHADGRIAGLAPGNGTLHVREGELAADVPLRVVATLARLTLEPARANPDAGGSVRYRALGYDAAGSPVELSGALAWRAANGIIDADGLLRVGASDAIVTAEAGGRRTAITTRVGRRSLPVEIFRPPVTWTFATYPPGGSGSASLSDGEGAPELELAYDFGGTARAAYANTRVDLASEPLGFSLDLRGDASGAGVRAAFLNSRGERVLVTIAKRVAWAGWQRRDVALPPSAVPPLRLLSLYVVAALGGPPVHGKGTIGFRSLRAEFAGSSTPNPPFTLPH